LSKLFRTDTKPKNYKYLTVYIINSICHDARIKFLKSLEKLLLKGLLRPSPAERQIPMESVSYFEGKNTSRVISVWLARISRKRKLGFLLYKINRFKTN